MPFAVDRHISGALIYAPCRARARPRKTERERERERETNWRADVSAASPLGWRIRVKRFRARHGDRLRDQAINL
jgi:hypothetical protein